MPRPSANQQRRELILAQGVYTYLVNRGEYMDTAINFVTECARLGVFCAN
jgi:hypothetical protein